MSATGGIRNFSELIGEIEKMKKAPEKVLKSVTSDAVKRVPGWVATEVSNSYNVKKGEITGGKIGTMKIKGNRVDELKFEYSGRVLTPTHFGMKPKAPRKNSYTVKATIIKGSTVNLGGTVKKLTKKQRKELGKNFRRQGTRTSARSPVMLKPAGGAGTTNIPFQRVSPNRKDLEVVKTLSLPQMIDNRAHEGISKAINDGLEKRLEHHMKRYMG